MQDKLMINNMYAAYSATSTNVDSKSVSDLSKMLKSRTTANSEGEEKAVDKAKAMDRVIISSEALSMLRAANN
ncbi:MAG: hypothetical protein LBH05_03620 [Deferribacteraceae bacterium]|nr:hypothetical protein [Deferribacteraceae bacterium]